MDEADEITVDTGEGRFACFAQGAADAPLALCLHGFPDTPRTWRFLTVDLARAGWRVVCPSLRGFGPNRLLDPVAAGPTALGRDANALHRALGGDARAILIGHDWGAAAAYAAAVAEPERWSRLVAASWPPAPADIDLASFDQMRRSWYVFLFQLPEAARLVSDPAFIANLWRVWAPDFDAATDAAAAADALRRAENGSLVLEHYRALFRGGDGALKPPRQPTLYIHGARDGCIGVELIEGLTAKLGPRSRVRVLDQVGHFPQLEAPAAVSSAVLGFLQDTRSAAPPSDSEKGDAGQQGKKAGTEGQAPH